MHFADSTPGCCRDGSRSTRPEIQQLKNGIFGISTTRESRKVIIDAACRRPPPPPPDVSIAAQPGFILYRQVCHKCRATGHVSKDCPEGRVATYQQPAPQCLNCGGDHLLQDCPIKEKVLCVCSALSANSCTTVCPSDPVVVQDRETRAVVPMQCASEAYQSVPLPEGQAIADAFFCSKLVSLEVAGRRARRRKDDNCKKRNRKRAYKVGHVRVLVLQYVCIVLQQVCRKRCAVLF